MLSLLSAAIEVCSRKGKVLVVCVHIFEPIHFYQVITSPSFDLKSRINRYLPKARQARKIDEFETIVGRAYILGYLERREFNPFKADFRSALGPESLPETSNRIASSKPDNCIFFDFQHDLSKRAIAVSSNFEDASIQSLVNRISDLKCLDWITK